MDSRWTRVHGRVVHARVADAAAGTPIVLVHGLGVSSAYLVPTALALASDHPVYAPDLPGFGRSEASSRTLDVMQLARELLAWMDAMGLERRLLLGNSLGCQVIVALTVAAPQRVAGLVLAGPTDGRPPVAHVRTAGPALVARRHAGALVAISDPRTRLPSVRRAAVLRDRPFRRLR